MTHPPPLFDRAALNARRARARRDAMFLHQAALDDVQDRLAMVNRTFTAPAVITGFPDFWAPGLAGAVVVPDDEVLALDRGRHDLVVHAMALHWANDPVGQLVQARLALKPDGLLLAVFPGGETLHQLRAVLGQAEIETTGGLSPRVAPMGGMRDLGALLQRAGLALPVADSQNLTAEYRDLTHLMHDLRAMGEANALTARRRQPTRRALFDRAATLYRDHFATPQGRLPATFELVCLTGWAPADDQPKPLRPGSAQMRLAQALGTTETPLPD
jgi:SAM-dependent methyltransferase